MKNLLFLLLLAITAAYPQKRTLTVDDLWNLKRIEGYDVNPAGDKAVFSLASFSMEDNKGQRDIYIVDVKSKDTKAILNSDKNETSPQFINNGSEIAFIKDGQIYTCGLDGSNEKQITDIYSGVNDFEFSKDGTKILFTSSVYPECKDDDCNKAKDEAKDKSKVKAQIFDELMYRHWNDWRGEKRGHLFLYNTSNKEYKDLTEGSKSDVPPIALGSANDYSFSPDGNQIVYTTNLDKFLATSTNNDVFLITDGKTEKISESKGNDNQPVFSPDGKFIAFVSMKRAGFEADKLDLIIYDKAAGKIKNITEKQDISVGDFRWSADSKKIYFIAGTEIYHYIYELDIASAKITPIVKEYTNGDILLNQDGTKIFFKQQSSNRPQDLAVLDLASKKYELITEVNKDLLSKIEMNPGESFWAKGEDGVKVQSVMIKPPFFDANKKYPMVFLIHGGPQGNFGDDFHYRWNTQMFAAQGYVVVAVNPRGSTGYGQKYVDQISQDWGGKAYTDLMNTYDYALSNFKFIDKSNTFAAGASYGGYMINWIAGHTNRFNALVSHAGVFNLESMYGTTEELWFTEWENGGTPWQNRKLYEKFSPHRFIHNAKTPMLVIQGAMDFRVPEEQAFQLFTSLQRLGVESKFLYYPDEFHFINKPQNAKLWWNTIFDWFNQHKKEPK